MEPSLFICFLCARHQHVAALVLPLGRLARIKRLAGRAPLGRPTSRQVVVVGGNDDNDDHCPIADKTVALQPSRTTTTESGQRDDDHLGPPTTSAKVSTSPLRRAYHSSRHWRGRPAARKGESGGPSRLPCARPWPGKNSKQTHRNLFAPFPWKWRGRRSLPGSSTFYRLKFHTTNEARARGAACLSLAYLWPG